MNIESIAATAIATALGYLAKGGEELAKGAGKDLWELIKKPFINEKDKALVGTLEHNPSNEVTKGVVEYKLGEFLEKDQDLAKELEVLCKNISLHRNVKNNELNQIGNNNIGFQDVTGSQITIKK